MAHFNFVISQNAKWGHAGFYIDCHRMTVPENILLQKKALDCAITCRPPGRPRNKTSGSTSCETTPHIRLETSGDVLSTVDMVVQ